jgi:hypothetical protein
VPGAFLDMYLEFRPPNQGVGGWCDPDADLFKDPHAGQEIWWEKRKLVGRITRRTHYRLLTFLLVTGWALWVVACGTRSEFYSGPLWLLDRGRVPRQLGLYALIGWMSYASFVSILAVRRPTRLPVYLAIPILPAWLTAGLFINHLADW